MVQRSKYIKYIMVWTFLRTFQDFLITFSGHPEFGTNYIGLVLGFFVTSLLTRFGAIGFFSRTYFGTIGFFSRT